MIQFVVGASFVLFVPVERSSPRVTERSLFFAFIFTEIQNLQHDVFPEGRFISLKKQGLLDLG